LDFLNSEEASLEVEIAEQIKYFILKVNETQPVLTGKEPPSPPLENILTYQEFNNDIYYLDELGYLFKADPSLTTKLKINEVPFLVEQGMEYELRIFQDYTFLEEDQTLYLFNPDSKSFEKFFESVKDLKISPDFKKLVYFNDSEIWILFLDYDPQPFHQKGDKVFLTRFSEKIGEVFWWTNHYLIFNTGDKIKIAEIDDRDRINIVDLAEFEAPEIFWNQKDKKLYLLSEGNLYVSGNLIF